MLHRRIASVLLVAIGVGLLVTVVAVRWGDDAPADQAAPLYHEGDAITVDNGDEFVVALTANPSTGYAWTAADNPDVTFVSSKQITGDGNLAGAPGTQEMTFRATKTGSTTLKLAYARSFEPGAPPAKTADFAVSVHD